MTLCPDRERGWLIMAAVYSAVALYASERVTRLSNIIVHCSPLKHKLETRNSQTW